MLLVAVLRCVTACPLEQMPGGRKLGQWIVGIGIGLYFTAGVFGQVADYWPLIFLGALSIVIPVALAVWWLRRCGEDSATAFFSSMPGGSAEMVNLGVRNGAVASRVAAAQSLRVTIIVLCAPALFRYVLGADMPVVRTAVVDWTWLAALAFGGGLAAWAWSRLKQPNPWFFGPLLVSAAASVVFNLKIGLPAGASQIAQVLIGSSLGCYFDRTFFRRAPAFLARSLCATLLIMSSAMLVAWLLSRAGSIDLRSMMLGMMPGGITEMSLTAASLNLSVPFVTALQIMRLLLVVFCAEPLFRRWRRHCDTG